MDGPTLALWTLLKGTPSEAKPEANVELSDQRRRRYRRKQKPKIATWTARPILANPAWDSERFYAGIPIWLRQLVPAEFVGVPPLEPLIWPVPVNTIKILQEPRPVEKASARDVLTLGQFGGIMLGVFGLVVFCLGAFFRYLEKGRINVQD